MDASFFLNQFEAGDMVTLRKQHPCGGTKWTLIRVAGDVTMRCQTCGRRMVLKRSALEKSCKAVDKKEDTEQIKD